jgi:hypothetical protein
MILLQLNRRRLLRTALGILPSAALADAATKENVIVFKEKGRYGGWPANSGIWAWGNEIVVGFTSAYFLHHDNDHSINRDKPQELWQARSLDAGRSWRLEKPAGIIPPENGGTTPKPLGAPLDFKKRDFAMMFRFGSINVGPTFFYISYDRCRTWQGPYSFEPRGIDNVAARTDYAVLGNHECLMLGSAAKADGKEGRVFCAKTTDGGLNWEVLSKVGPEPAGYMIMPSTVRLGKERFLTTIRHYDPGKQGSIDAYLSEDGGRSWSFVCEAAPKIGGGNPPALVRLHDGRLSLTYGYRAKPYGVRARISPDEGKTWGDEIVLRDDALSGDLGYPRAIQLPDGKMLSVYYFNGPNDEDRAIEATIWKP